MKYLALALLGLLPPLAHAAEFNRVQADRSSIAFSFSQMGVHMEGRFAKFASQLSFDPAAPAEARVTIEVDLASIDTGTPEIDTEAAGQPWFNIKAFPVARFTSTAVTPGAGNRYTVAGKLSIKGKTRGIVVPATFSAQGNTGTFAGRFTLRRGDFAIGEGPWSTFDIVANEVEVDFRLVALSQ
jgi:polyisoprenoid-binding protein YceI